MIKVGGSARLRFVSVLVLAFALGCGGSSAAPGKGPSGSGGASGTGGQSGTQTGQDAAAPSSDSGGPSDNPTDATNASDASPSTTTPDAGATADVPAATADAVAPAPDGSGAATDAPASSSDGPAADAQASLADGSAPPPVSVGYRLFPQANSTSAYAISMTAELWSWGANGSGQLGHAGATTPAMVTALGTMAAACAGGEIHAIAVSKDGNAFTFGTNFSGQLGNTVDTGTFTNPHPIPSMVALPTGVKALPSAAAGERYAAVLADDGNVYMWGGNLYGQQANKTNIGNMTANPAVHMVPKPTGVTTWKTLGGGYSHLLTVAQDDQLWAWGDNRQGQLGVGTMGGAPDGVLKAVTKPSGVIGWAYAVGGRDFTLGMASNGALYAWGANDMGQLAAAGASQPTPTLVNLPSGATGWRKIAAGKDHAAAITTEGKLYTWGNGSGAAPKEVAPPTGVASWIDVTASVAQVIATGVDGKVYSWATGGKPAAAMAGLP